jgi:ABC-type dipeptide/oligopeptide/nickel transport system permease component
MLNYIFRRLLLLFPTLIGITIIVFAVIALSPGGVGGSLLNDQGNLKGDEMVQMRAYYEKRYGLNKPLPVQYLRWLNHISPIGFESLPDGSTGEFKFLKSPDLGTSFSKSRPVLDLVKERLPITLLLNVLTVPIIYTVSVITGIYAARRKGGFVDVFTSLAYLALWSVPVILGGVLMIGFLANRDYVQWFPTGGLHDIEAAQMTFLPSHSAAGWERGWLLDMAWHLLLPVVCLSYGGFAFLSRLTRGSMLENIGSDYTRTARAKGLPENVVIYRHVFRNSLIPLITSSAGLLPGLLGGSFIVEKIFSIQGMGMLTLDAITTHDRELILDNALIVGGLGLLAYLVSDLLYVLVDPRVTFE